MSILENDWYYWQGIHEDDLPCHVCNKPRWNCKCDQHCPTCGNPASEPKESQVGLNEFKTCTDEFHEE